jgi:aminomethyltransferase
VADHNDSAQPLRKTPLAEEHERLGARMVPFAGWHMPVQYSGVKQEHLAVRAAAGLFDVSHMGELELEGDEAGAVIDHIITNDASALADGQALYTCACNESGTILDDLIVYRRDASHWLVVCNASNRDKMLAHFRAHAEGRCQLEDASDRTALIALQGPKALAIASRSGDDGAALAELGGFHLRSAELCGVRCTVARTG